METPKPSQVDLLQSELARIEESDTSKGYDFEIFKKKHLINVKIGEIKRETKKSVIKDEVVRIASLEEKDPKGWDEKLSDQRIFLNLEKEKLEDSRIISSDIRLSLATNRAYRKEADRLDDIQKDFKRNHITFHENGKLIPWYDNAGEIKKVSESYRKKGLQALAFSQQANAPQKPFGIK